MASFSLDMTGVDEVIKAADELSLIQKRGVLVKGVAAAARAVKKSARKIVPQPGYPGDKKGFKPLRDTIGSKVKEYPGGIYAFIGPRWPAGAHGHNVEFGHKIAGTSRYTKATDFMSKALTASETAMNQLTQFVADAIEKEFVT